MGTGDAGTVHCDSIGPSVARMSSDENTDIPDTPPDLVSLVEPVRVYGTPGHWVI